MSQSIGLGIVVSAQTDPLAKDLKTATGMIDRFDKAASGGGNITFNQLAHSLRDVRAEASRTESALGRIKRIAATGLVGGFFGAAGMAGFGSLGGISDAVGDSVRLASEFEKTQGAFEVMLGSAERAKDVIGEIRKFGADSPFNFAGLTETSKQLAAFGIASDQIVPTLKMLGEAAVGDQEKLNRLAYAYGQVKAAGRLYGTELRQFTETGLPINKALAGVMTNSDGSRVQEESVKNLVEEGRVGFSDVVKAFKSMTQEGGQFFGMTDKYAKTFAGSMERVKDAVDLTKQEFGTALIEELGLKDATKDLEVFSDRLRRGITDIRPWIRTIGEMGRGVIQVGYEFAKAGLEIGGGYVDRLVSQIPELDEVRKILTGIGNSPDGFRIDPAKARDLGNAFAQATEGIFTNIISAGKEFKREVVDPIVAVAKDLRDTADYLKEFGKTASDIRTALTGRDPRIEGKDLRTAEDRERQRGFDWSRNGTLAGPIESKDPLFKAFQEQETRYNAAKAAVDRLEKFNWATGSVLAYGQAKQALETERKPLADLQAKIAARADSLTNSFQYGPQAAEQMGEFYRPLPGQGWKPTSPELAPMPRAASALGNLADQANKAATGMRNVDNAVKVPEQISPMTRMAAEQANKQFRNPMDVFRESQRDLTDAKDRGLITDDVFNRAIADKFRDLTQSGGIEREFQLPSAMEFGSAAAASTIANQRSGPSVVSLLEAIANSSSENAKLADGILRQLAAADQSVPVLLPR